MNENALALVFKKQIQTQFICHWNSFPCQDLTEAVGKGISFSHLFDIYYLYILVDKVNKLSKYVRPLIEPFAHNWIFMQFMPVPEMLYL